MTVEDQFHPENLKIDRRYKVVTRLGERVTAYFQGINSAVIGGKRRLLVFFTSAKGNVGSHYSVTTAEIASCSPTPVAAKDDDDDCETD